ncbi:MAG: hypothetical protein ACE5EM_04790 [Sphingomonadales bacterium]
MTRRQKERYARPGADYKAVQNIVFLSVFAVLVLIVAFLVRPDFQTTGNTEVEATQSQDRENPLREP